MTNNAPGQAAARSIDALVAQSNQTQPPAPPGGMGHQYGAIKSQLAQGNPGGVGQASGIGIQVEADA